MDGFDVFHCLFVSRFHFQGLFKTGSEALPESILLTRTHCRKNVVVSRARVGRRKVLPLVGESVFPVGVSR